MSTKTAANGVEPMPAPTRDILWNRSRGSLKRRMALECQKRRDSGYDFYMHMCFNSHRAAMVEWSKTDLRLGLL